MSILTVAADHLLPGDVFDVSTVPYKVVSVRVLTHPAGLIAHITALAEDNPVPTVVRVWPETQMIITRGGLGDQLPPATVDCEKCGGTGYTLVQHPRWGSPFCPEPDVEVPCPECGGGS